MARTQKNKVCEVNRGLVGIQRLPHSFRPSAVPLAAEPAPITHSHCLQATAGHLGMLKVRAAPRHGDWAFLGALGAPAQCRGTTTEVEQQSA